MEQLLIEGQGRTQLLTAEGISTLFNGREDLFDDLPLAVEDFENLYAHPLQSPVRLDGQLDDWGADMTANLRRFGSETFPGDGDLQLVLGERGGNLHAFLQITDPDIVFRDPDYLRLDASDHIRLTFIRANGAQPSSFGSMRP